MSKTKITKLQIKAIHAQKRTAGLTEDDYRAAVSAASNGRTETSKELSFIEANELLVKLGGRAIELSRRTRQRRNKAAGVISLMTNPQRQVLYGVAMERWGESYQTPLAALCRRVIKRDAPATSKEAQRMIEVLKAMNAREGKAA